MRFTTQTRTRRGRALAAATLATLMPAAALWTAGCSSGGITPLNGPVNPGDGNGPTRQAGTLSLNIQWPPYEAPSTRLLPVAAKSIRVVVTDANGNNVAGTLASRPSSGNTTKVLLNEVPSGQVTVTATAYPESNGSGIAQARGSVPVEVKPVQVASVTLTLDSTIDRVQITPAAPEVAPGGTVELVATALNADGDTVLTAPSKWTWAKEGAAVTVTPNGDRASVRGVSLGTASVTATETESGKEGTVTVAVKEGVGISGAPWPKARGNVRNTGHLPGVNAPATTPTARWTYTAPANVVTPPIVGEGAVYVGTLAGQVIALKTTDGSVLWSVNTGATFQGIIAPMALTGGGVLYVAATDGTLRALDAATGQQKWTASVGTIYAGPSVAENGTIYAVAYTLNGEVIHSLNASGGLNWTYTIGAVLGNTQSAPALGADGTIYAGSAAGLLTALTSGGARRWEATPGQRVLGASPSVGADGTVYLGAADGTVRAFNGATGQQRWAFATGAASTGATGNVAGTGIGPSGEVIAPAEDNLVYSLRGDNGQKRWSVAAFPNAQIPVFYSAPAIDASGRVVIAYTTREFPTVTRVVALAAANGAVLWEFPVENLGNASRPPDPSLGGDGTVYMASGNKVYALK